MTEVEQFNLLRTWLIRVTGLPEILRTHPDGGPRVFGEYGTLNLLRSQRINNPDDLEYEDAVEPGAGEPVNEIPVQEWSWGWSLNVYGAGCADRMMWIPVAMKSPAALLRLHPLTLHDTSMIRRLPQQVNNVWEDRAQMDLDVRGIVRIGFGADLVETVPVVLSNERGVVATTTLTKP